MSFAHLSRNADALVNVLDGLPTYVSGEAGTPTSSGTRRAWTDSSRTCGRARPGSSPRARRRGLEAHGGAAQRGHELRDPGAVPALGEDEAASRGPGDRVRARRSPEEFVEREIAFLADRFTGHPEVPSTRITDATRVLERGTRCRGRPARSP